MDQTVANFMIEEKLCKNVTERCGHVVSFCRFRVGFQLDLLLLLKLAVVVFVFNQDGSKDRLFLLLFLAGVVYL